MKPNQKTTSHYSSISPNSVSYGSVDASNVEEQDDGVLHESFVLIPIDSPKRQTHYSKSGNDDAKLLEGTTPKSCIGDNVSEEEYQQAQLPFDKSFLDYFFSWLGFVENPFRATTSGNRNSAASDLRLALLSNFSTAYNIVSISLALSIISKDIQHATAEQKSLCSSALIAGMIVGQIVGGTLGDVLGRHVAMTVVMALQVLGALASAMSISINESSLNIYVILAVWRFMLGLGCGGVYPLAATMTAETCACPQDRAKAVALTFSMQGVGYLVVPLFGWACVTILPPDMAWRMLLGCGAIPGFVLMVMRLKRQHVIQQQFASSSSLPLDTMRSSSMLDIPIGPTEMAKREVPVSVMKAIQMEPNLISKLLGTAGCWLLFDVLFYGNTLFQPVVLSAAFGNSETLEKTAMDTSIIAAMALPGYFVSVVVMSKYQSPRSIQAQGFLIMGILYAFIGVYFHALATHNRYILLCLYGMTFFFSNYGPNATTYMLPSITFSRPCRSTLNGVCAACGKAGALLGSLIFVTAASRYGQSVIMLSCSVLSIIGMIITLFCVSKQVGLEQMPSQISLSNKKLQNSKRYKVPMKTVVSTPSLLDYPEFA